MAAACIRNRKIVPTLASPIMHRWMATRTAVVSTQQRLANHCINGQHVRRPAGPEKSKCFVPRPRLYGTSLSPWWGTRRKSRHPTYDHNHDRAVDKAIKHCHELIKDDEVDQSIKIYPVRGAREYMGGVEMFHILLKTTGGKKYVAIYVAPQVHSHSYHEDEALKPVFFRKLDNDNNNISLPLRKVVGDYRWPVSPRNDPLITAAARFALAEHNKEEKLAHLIRATSQMVGENEIFRMTFKAELSGGSRNYDAIVLVPRENPEKMELVVIKINDGWQLYGRLMFSHGLRHIVPHTYPVTRYEYEDEDGDDENEEEDEDEDEVKVEYEYEDDECVTDDPRVIAAARFALSQYNEKDQVRLDNKKDQVRRVVEATRRTYSGDEILNLRFDGELDGSWFYEAIVLVPVNDPENMRLAYCGRNWDDRDDDDEDEHEYGYERFDVYKYGFGECSIYDPRVTEAARFALALHNEKDKRKDKLLRVVKATSHINSEGMTWRLRFVGEDHPLRTYVAIVSVPVKEPQDMQVDYVLPEVHGP